MTTLAAPPSLSSAARLFQALSDETRLAVLDMLAGGELCVCDLQSALGAAQSRLSFHLKVLRDNGLVRDRKEGRWSYYSLVPERLDEVRALLDLIGTERPRLVRLARAGRDAESEGGFAVPAADGCCG